MAKTRLEYTAFNVGWFMEYYGMPHVETYITQTTFIVDMANKHAAIPGDGTQLMTFTYTKDVAKFVVAALDLPTWDRNTFVIGDKMTWNDFVKLAEKARGTTPTIRRVGGQTHLYSNKLTPSIQVINLPSLTIASANFKQGRSPNCPVRWRPIPTFPRNGSRSSSRLLVSG